MVNVGKRLNNRITRITTKEAKTFKVLALGIDERSMIAGTQKFTIVGIQMKLDKMKVRHRSMSLRGHRAEYTLTDINDLLGK